MLERIQKIASIIKKEGGRAFFVGGYVRDLILGIPSKDIDVEVYGITPQRLIEILSRFGEVDVVGKSFGVIKVKGLDVDFTMPRRERKIGEGHKGFEVSVDPFMSFEEACRRRDFTMNAIMMDVLTKEIIDPYGGVEDIKNKIIRHIDACTYIEDPLRVYRAAQFAGRLGFKIDPGTVELCRSIDLSSLSNERVFGELNKLLLKSDRPSIGFEYLKEMGVIERYFPLLNDLIDCPQPAVHHPEGDVWSHVVLVLNEAAKLRSQSKSPDSFMWAALLHDVGKPATTKEEDGRITSHGHEVAGEKLAVEFLKELSGEKRLISEVGSLVRYHMSPLSLYPNAKDSAIRRLASKCDLHEVLLLHEADYKGRALDTSDFESRKIWFQEKIKSLSLEEGIKPLVRGRDLIRIGFTPGPHFGRLLKQAFEMQLDGLDKEEILDTLKAYL